MTVGQTPFFYASLRSSHLRLRTSAIYSDIVRCDHIVTNKSARLGGYPKGETAMTNQTRSAVHDAATKAETLAYNLASASSLASVLSEVLDKELVGTNRGAILCGTHNAAGQAQRRRQGT